LATSPSVPYKIILKKDKTTEVIVNNPSDFPEEHLIYESYEPIALVSIITPKLYMGDIIKLCQEKRGEQINISYIEETRILIEYKIPLPEIISEFHDRLKSISSGYASMNYTDDGYKKSDLVKVGILINGELVSPLSVIVPQEKAYNIGKVLVVKLKEILDRQLFEYNVQASIGNKIIARETIKAYRKNATAKCYGGDVTRKRKLIDRQKEGKKKNEKIWKSPFNTRNIFVCIKVQS